MSRIYIIAEAGVNHDGSIEKAKLLIDQASEAGVDAIKFQTFSVEKLICPNIEKADYQKSTTNPSESQDDMLRKLQISEDDHFALRDYCKEKSIEFLSSAFDLDSLDFLNSLDMPVFKIPSGEITNLPYLIKVASFGKKVILSTGMSTIPEIEEALVALTSNGLTKDKITLLHCTTQYPTPPSDVNLKAINTIKDTFDIAVGYSDHTLGIEVSLAAVSLGAEIIEKHFTYDKKASGPDHQASLDKSELSALVKGIRKIEESLGDGSKKPTSIEKKNMIAARKSIVASKTIEEGETFSEANLTVKRPFTGISPMKWKTVIGTKAKRKFLENECIEL